MPLLVQICVVIVTIAVAALAVVSLRMMTRFDKTASDIQETLASLRSSLRHVQDVADEARRLVASAGEIVPHLKAVATRFEQVGDRAAELSQVVLEEVEAPVRSAVAMMRGVRTGTASFMDRFARRFIHRSHANGRTSP